MNVSFDDAVWETRVRDAAYTAVGLGVIACKLAQPHLDQLRNEAKAWFTQDCSRQ